MAVEQLDAVLAPDGWAYASAPSQEPGDPGRYHALFGRDALITALQLLPGRPDIAAATLRALAALQGRREDDEDEEQPGRIPHEFWPSAPAELGAAGFPVRDGRLLHYGSADATQWFCVLLAATGDTGLRAELSDAWRAAGAWIERALEEGGGFVRWERRGPGGLLQQGWRDAVDPLAPEAHGGGILRADGTVPATPVADADTQAVTVVALRALARLSGERRFERSAADLRRRVTEAFDPDTMALEGDGRRVPGAGSQLGWLVWAGAVEPDALEAFAARLCEPDVLTAHGLRTLSSEHPCFAPDAYHRGSIWPFDSWLGWGGLRAAGRADEAESVRRGVLEAIERLGQAPELYAVERDGALRPIAVANRIQAWTIGAREALRGGWDGRSA